MGLPTAEIQTAAIARMRGDTTLQGLLVGSVSPTWNVFDFDAVTVNQAFPYIACAPITNTTSDAMTFVIDATDSYYQISVFTQYAGFSQARSIAKQVYSLFNRQALTLTGGFTNVFLLFDNASEEPQSDGLTQHIPMRFKMKTQG